MVEFRDGLFFVSWIDDEMGLLAQIIDLEADTVVAQGAEYAGEFDLALCRGPC